jgi:TRAP-type uncharacterized transport system fused permease subunit
LLVEPEKIQVEDFEAQPRRLGPMAGIIASVMSIGLSLFQLYTSYEGPFNDFVQRSIHLAFVFPLVFLMYPFSRKSANKDKVSLADKAFFVLSLAATLWVAFNNVRFFEHPGDSITIDLILSLFMVIIILEGSRRILGPALPVIAGALIIYALLGPNLPGMWGHRGFSIPMILESLYVGNNGIWGFVVGISATTIAGFLIFGVVLSKTG